MTNSNFNFTFFKIFSANFKSDRSAFNFPIVKLEAGIVVFSVVYLNSNSCWLKLFCNFVCFIYNLFAVVILEKNRNNNNLNLSYSWWKDDTSIIRVNHNHRANWSCWETPGGLPNEWFLFVLIFKPHVKHFTKVLTKHMASCSLDSPAADRNV